MTHRAVWLCLLSALAMLVSGCAGNGEVRDSQRDVKLKLSAVDVSQGSAEVALPVDTDEEIAQVVAVYLNDAFPEMLPSATIWGIGEGSLEIEGTRLSTIRVYMTADRDADYYYKGYLDITAKDGYVRGALPLVKK